MSSCVFASCCGCLDLRTGCLLIGYFNLVGQAVQLCTAAGVVGAGGLAAGGARLLQDLGLPFLLLSALSLLILLSLLATSVVLVVGIHRNKRGLVKAHLVVKSLCLALSLATNLAFMLVAASSSSSLLQVLITLPLSIYFLLVIRSYYLKMGASKGGPPYDFV